MEAEHQMAPGCLTGNSIHPRSRRSQPFRLALGIGRHHEIQAGTTVAGCLSAVQIFNQHTMVAGRPQGSPLDALAIDYGQPNRLDHNVGHRKHLLFGRRMPEVAGNVIQMAGLEICWRATETHRHPLSRPFARDC